MFKPSVLEMTFALGALCILLGFYLVVRGIGTADGESRIKLFGFEVSAGRVGPGVLFAMFGLVLAMGVLVTQTNEPPPSTLTCRDDQKLTGGECVDRGTSAMPKSGPGPTGSEITGPGEQAPPPPAPKVVVTLPPSAPNGSASTEPNPTRAAALAKLGRVDRPFWLREPSLDDLALYYPDRAQRLDLRGDVRLECMVMTTGTLGACAVIDEAPAEYGFADAAIKITRLYQMRSTDFDDFPVEGRSLRMNVKFDGVGIRVSQPLP